MLVLHLPKWYPNRYDGQDGDFVERHVAAIAAQPGLQVAVVYAAVARESLPSLVALDADLAGPVPALRYYYRAAPTGWTWVDKPLKLLLYFVCLARGYGRIRQHWGGRRPDLVHVHVLLRTGLAAGWLRWAQGIPYVVTEHWTRYLPGRAAGIGRLRRWLTAAVVRRAAALHTVSDNLRTALAALGAVNALSAVIPNVVDTDLFQPADFSPQQGAEETPEIVEATAAPTSALPKTKNQKPKTNPTLLHVAAFNEAAKNLCGLLRVVAGLRAAVPGLRLRVGGYGPDEALVRQQAADLGLLANGTVQFLGKLAHEAVAAEMQQATAFVLFSNYENLPCVLIEAQASGLPAVATRVGGVPELLPEDGRYGALVPVGDEAALAATLATVLRRATTGAYDPSTLRANALTHYSVAAVGAAFGALYRKVLAPA